MKTQRKIHHLLANNGKAGRDFGYLLELSPKHNFDWSEEITVTSKIDGTTAQSDNQHLYQRRDNFKKGDPKKHNATKEERYHLEELNVLAPENKWIFNAYNRYKYQIAQIPDDYVVYFECFGDKIQSRYKGLPQDIRVFDFGLKDAYLHFSDTIELCNSFNLPIVGHTNRKFSGVKEIVEALVTAEHIDPSLKQYNLEGWVLRQGEQIAKIRKNDLKKIVA